MSIPKIFNVVGARPQIIKSAALSRAFSQLPDGQVREIIVHTGQHYDRKLSGVFFEEMGIPRPHLQLNVGSASHGKQTADMLQGLEELMLGEKPDLVLVYGDTNSTLAAALAASKLRIPVAHVEAGLRSYNKSMPEEINRIVCDHVSTLLYAPTFQATENLALEGIVHSESASYSMDRPAVLHSGDVMFDNALHYGETAVEQTGILDRLGLGEGRYLLATIHRDLNTDSRERLEALLSTLAGIATDHRIKVVLPMHPRTRKMVSAFNLEQTLRSSSNLRVTDPVSYLEMIALEKHALMVLTDSGGVQKEAHFFRKPCLVFRRETEWVELVENGTARLVDADPFLIIEAFEQYRENRDLHYPAFYGSGEAAPFICQSLLEFLEHHAR